MIKIYAVALVVGVVCLAGVILWSSLPGKETPGERVRLALGGLLGFGMGGMAAEYSPLDLSWPVALILAVVASAASVLWVRFAGRRESE